MLLGMFSQFEGEGGCQGEGCPPLPSHEVLPTCQDTLISPIMQYLVLKTESISLQVP